MKRIIKTADEQDVHTPWRHLLAITGKPGWTKSVKRATNRRERREKRRWINEE